jgi:hypothetical protein
MGSMIWITRHKKVEAIGVDDEGVVRPNLSLFTYLEGEVVTVQDGHEEASGDFIFKYTCL